MTLGIMAISLLFMVIGMVVQFRLKSKFKEYGSVPTSSGLSGKEVAQKMLRDNGIYDVDVVSVQGFLSDHYDPSKKTVNLSPDVYEGRNVSAAAVAAHECGHAVQHAERLQGSPLPATHAESFSNSDSGVDSWLFSPSPSSPKENIVRRICRSTNECDSQI